jgi:hypothetical protein
MAGAVRVGALVIDMAADVASLKTNLAEARQETQQAGSRMADDLSAIRKGIESAIAPLQSVTVKIGSLESQLRRAQDAALSLAKGMLLGAAAGASIDTIAHKITGVIESMASLKEYSERTGASVENLSRLNFFAKQAGSDIDAVSGSLNRLARGMTSADDETKGTGQALAFLGLSARDAAGKLKDPAELFTEIAKKLDTYRDGAGKAAIAQVLFGKSGTEMLPIMKEMAEQGDIVAKVTTDQSNAADHYTKDVAKLEAQKGALYKTVATALLPTMSDFTSVMLQASTNTNIANSAVKGLAQDKSLESWADDVAMGLAFVIDTVKLMPSLFSTATAGFGSLAALAKTTVLAMPGVSLVSEEGALEKALKDQEQAQMNYGEQIYKLLNSEVDATRKAMQAKIDARAKDAAAAKEAAKAREAADAAKKDLNYPGSNDGSAAADKEAQAYSTLISAIRTKTAENRVELAIFGQLSDSQKMTAKLDEEIAAGKIKLTAAHEAAARAALVELGVAEQAVRAQTAQREVTKYIAASTQARLESAAALQVEYALFGKSADAREIEMVALRAHADTEKELDAQREKGLPITDQILTQLAAEERARILVGQAVLGQTKALQYAAQLAEENKRFGLDYILDDQARANATLALDAKVWQERIRLAGDGTEAQRLLQEQYDQWYQNQLLKPQLAANKAMWSSIEQTAHDTFVSIFDTGKSAFNRLRDALKNGLLDLLYQLTMKQWIINIGASVGLGGAAGVAQAASGAAGGTGTGLIGAAQMASSLYKAVSGGFAGIGAGIGTGASALGGLLGSSSISAFGAGMGLSAEQAAAAMAAYSEAGMAGTASAIGYGQLAGTAAGYGAGLLGGHYLGNAIAGDYSVNHGQAVTNIASAVGAAVAGPIGAVVGGALGGLYNRAFGMGPTQVKNQGMQGTLTASSLTGLNYQDLHQDGGWFRSDKDWQTTSNFTAATVSQFTQGLSAIETASSSFAKALGVNADSIKDYSKVFDLKLTGDATKDQQIIVDFFASIGDEIANSLVPNLAAFSKSGETASATLQRLAGDFQSTDQMAQLLGKSASAVFGDVGVASTAARERLIELAGGTSVLGQQAASYAQNFLTEAQRLAPVSEALNAAMSSLGLSSIQTREQFKACIDSLDLTTEAGAKQFTAMMALAGAFAQVHPVVNDVSDILSAQAQMYEALGDKVGAATVLEKQHALALESMSPALAQATKEMWAAQAAAKAISDVKVDASTLMSGVDGALSALQKVVAREKAALQDKINTETELVNKYTALSSALHSALDGMTTPDQAVYDRMAAQAQIKTALAIARAGGSLPTADSLKTALAALGKDSTGQFATYQDYLVDFYATKNNIADLAGLTDNSLSVEQKSLDALNDQVKSLDALLAREQDSIDVLKGISANGLTLIQAVEGLHTAILSAQANPVNAATSAVSQAYQTALGRAPDAAGLAFWQQQAAAGTSVSDIVKAITASPEATIQGMYQTMLGRSADAGGLNFWLNSGASMSDIANAIMGSSEFSDHQKKLIPGFAGGGDFGGGWRIVGENGPELEATGPSRIFNASQTASLMSRLSSPSENSAAIVSELKSLREENRQLRRMMESHLYAVAKNTMKAADSLDGAVNGTRPLITQSA